MRKSMLLSGLTAAALLGACKEVPKDSPEAPPAEVAAPAEPAVPVDPAAAPHRFASWSGKWTGVEGMFVTITPAAPGLYTLEMQSDLDTKGTYDGRDGEHGIQFERGGETLSLTRSSGDDIGLKYLADKKACLKVKDGEGYCRD